MKDRDVDIKVDEKDPNLLHVTLVDDTDFDITMETGWNLYNALEGILR